MEGENQEAAFNQPLIVQRRMSLSTKRMTKMYCSLLREFRVFYSLYAVLCLGMCALFASQYFRCARCEGDDRYLQIWMLFAFVTFGFQALFNFHIVIPSLSTRRAMHFAGVLFEVVENVSLLSDEPYEGMTTAEKRKKRKLTDNLIINHFKQYYKINWYFDILLTLANLALVYMGVTLFFINRYTTVMFSNKFSFVENCDFSSGWITFWTLVLICICKKNAISMTLLFVVAFPIIVCYVSMKAIQNNKHNNETRKDCTHAMKSIKYHPNNLQGDEHCCPICRCDYTIGSSLKVLPCSDLHHFHSKCIWGWLKISKTCPLCRTEVGIIKNNLPIVGDDHLEGEPQREISSSNTLSTNPFSQDEPAAELDV